MWTDAGNNRTELEEVNTFGSHTIPPRKPSRGAIDMNPLPNHCNNFITRRNKHVTRFTHLVPIPEMRKTTPQDPRVIKYPNKKETTTISINVNFIDVVKVAAVVVVSVLSIVIGIKKR